MPETNIRILPFYKTKEGYRCPACGQAFKGLPPGCNKCWTLRLCGKFIETE